MTHTGPTGVYQFVIQGNPDDPNGNPMPKLKLTKGQHWHPRVKKYVAWRGHVQESFLRELSLSGDILYHEVCKAIAMNLRPLQTSKQNKMTMDIVIHWKNDAHGDPENVFGSIADALFDQDKFLYGSFAEGDSRGEGKVEVVIKPYKKAI